jgi:hypothetical protein
MKKELFLVNLLSLLLFSVISFGQTYSGPATGSVDAGVIVTTDDFVFTPIGSEDIKEPRVYEFMEYDPPPMYYEGDKPVSDNYVYVEDESAKTRG